MFQGTTMMKRKVTKVDTLKYEREAVASNLNLPAALLMNQEEIDAKQEAHIARQVKQRGNTVKEARNSWGLLIGRRGSNFEVRLNPILERCGLDPAVDEELAQIDYDLVWVGLLGLVLGVVQLEICWSFAEIDLYFVDDASIGSGIEEGKVRYGETPQAALILQYMVSFFTLVLVIRLKYYYDFITYARARVWNSLDRKSNSLMNNIANWPSFLVEFLILVAHPYPSCPESINKYLTQLMFLRIYLFLRYIRDQDETFRSRKEIVVAIYRDVPNAPFNSFHVLQILFSRDPFRFLSILFVLFWAVLGYWAYINERDNQPASFTLFNSYWYCFTTMTTLGFGDFTVNTLGGRLLTVIATIAGVLVNTLFTVSILQQISLTHYQEMAMNFLDRRWAVLDMRDVAARFIQEWCRFNMYCKTQAKHRRQKNLHLLDDQKTYLQRRRNHHRAIMELTRLRAQVRRQQQLVQNTVGDPVMDKLNSLHKNMFMQEANISQEITAKMDDIQSETRTAQALAKMETRKVGRALQKLTSIDENMKRFGEGNFSTSFSSSLGSLPVESGSANDGLSGADVTAPLRSGGETSHGPGVHARKKRHAPSVAFKSDGSMDNLEKLGNMEPGSGSGSEPGSGLNPPAASAGGGGGTGKGISIGKGKGWQSVQTMVVPLDVSLDKSGTSAPLPTATSAEPLVTDDCEDEKEDGADEESDTFGALPELRSENGPSGVTATVRFAEDAGGSGEDDMASLSRGLGALHQYQASKDSMLSEVLVSLSQDLADIKQELRLLPQIQREVSSLSRELKRVDQRLDGQEKLLTGKDVVEVYDPMPSGGATGRPPTTGKGGGGMVKKMIRTGSSKVLMRVASGIGKAKTTPVESTSSLKAHASPNRSHGLSLTQIGEGDEEAANSQRPSMIKS